jgi:diguanylate cyclase (GGDEF)-like protein
MDHDIALPGRRVKQKICVALAVSSVIPLLILTYALYVHVLPWLDPARHARDVLWVEALLVFTALLIAAGAFIIWDLARAVSHTASLVALTPGDESTAPRRTDEVGLLMTSFTRMLSTIEAQAGDINQFALRLEGAYKELEQTNARLKEFSFKDEVTGLYNRRFLSVRLEEEVSRYRRFGHPVSVVLLDLDGFKAVNDGLGHAAGDEALRDVGRILLEYSRGINVISRWGGDEFAVVLVETVKAGAQSYAERIRRVLATHPFAHGRPLTASFGVAALPEDATLGADDLIRAADEALYAAKRAGKNQVCIHDDITPHKEAHVG